MMKVVSHVRIGEEFSLADEYARAVANIDRITSRLKGKPGSYPMESHQHDEAVVDRFQPNTSPERYRDIVNKAKQYISRW